MNKYRPLKQRRQSGKRFRRDQRENRKRRAKYRGAHDADRMAIASQDKAMRKLENWLHLLHSNGW